MLAVTNYQNSVDAQLSPAPPHSRHELQKERAQLLPSLLSEQLPTHFPDLFDSRIRVTAHERQGWTNATLSISTQQSEEYIARVSFGEDTTGSQHFGARWSVYEKERFWQDYLRSSDPEFAAIVPRVVGVCYLAKEELPRVLQAQLPSHDSLAIGIQERMPGLGYDQWNGDLLKQASYELGRCAVKINQIVPPGTGSRFNPEEQTFYLSANNGNVEMPKLIEWRIEASKEAITILKDENVVSPATYKNALWLLELYRDCDLSPRLVHGDLNPGCVLLDAESGRASGLFDFETIRSGPGIYDELASRYTNMDQPVFDNFLKGYCLGLDIDVEEFKHHHIPAIHGAALVQELVFIACDTDHDKTKLKRVLREIDLD